MSKGPESAQGVGLVILFPLAIVSNGLVPTQHMPAVLRFIADWNPVSAVTAAAAPPAGLGATLGQGSTGLCRARQLFRNVMNPRIHCVPTHWKSSFITLGTPG